MIFFLFSLACLSAAPAATALTPTPTAPALDKPVGSEVMNDMVLIDGIDVMGQTASSVSVLRTVIDIPIGIALPRGALEQRLNEARLRVLALGFYREVLLHLARGSDRGHYRLVVQGEAYASAYQGAGASVLATGGRNIAAYMPQRQFSGSFFWGDRNWRDSGVWLDGEVLAGGGAVSMHSQRFAYDGRYQLAGLQISTFAPNLGGGRFVAGLNLGLVYSDIDMRARFHLGDTLSEVASRSREVSADGVAQAGVRFGLATLSGVIRTSDVRTLPGSRAGNGIVRALGVKATYSEKSYLALVEPGLDLQVDALRRLWRGAAYSSQVNAGLLYTWMPGESFGLTPGFRSDAAWYPNDDYAYVGEREIYLHVDWVTTAHWVVSCEPRWTHRQSQVEGWQNGLTVTARYAASDALYSFSVILGEDGLEHELTPGPREQLR